MVIEERGEGWVRTHGIVCFISIMDLNSSNVRVLFLTHNVLVRKGTLVLIGEDV